MRRNEPCKNCTEYWAPSQVCRETEGERLHDPDVQHDHPDGILCATSTPRPRPGVGGRGDRRADVWRVGRCDRGMLPRGRPPVVRDRGMLPRGRPPVVPGCAAATCVLLVRWTRFAPPAASKPSADASNGTKLDRPRYGTALCTSIVHSGLWTAATASTTAPAGGRPVHSVRCRPPRTEIRVGSRTHSACDELYSR